MENQRRITNESLMPQIVVDKFMKRGLFGSSNYFLNCRERNGVEDLIQVDYRIYKCVNVGSLVYAACFGEDNQRQRRALVN